MRIVSCCLKDPFLHVALTIVMLLAFVLVMDSNASRRSSWRAAPHPSHCHACSTTDPHLAQHRDAALAKMGAIDPAEIID
jgi:hypothetical protein